MLLSKEFSHLPAFEKSFCLILTVHQLKISLCTSETVTTAIKLQLTRWNERRKKEEQKDIFPMLHSHEVYFLQNIFHPLYKAIICYQSAWKETFLFFRSLTLFNSDWFLPMKSVCHCLLTCDCGGTGVMFATWLEMGKIFSWSSITMQFLHEARDRMNLSSQAKATQ